MKTFQGVWATFDSPKKFNAAYAVIKDKTGTRLFCHLPFVHREFTCQKRHSSFNVVKICALLGGILGALGSFYLIYRMDLGWIQPLSAKPIFSPLAILPVVFELTILVSVICTLLAVIGLTWHDRLRRPTPSSKHYLDYKRFTRDRFAIVVHCDPGQIYAINEIFRQHQAEEVFIEG